MQGLKLCFNRRDIGIDQVIEQAGLLRIHLLAALGKLQTLELCDLVGELLDNRLIAIDLLAHRLDRLTQCVDLMVERLDTLYQLRHQSAQLFSMRPAKSSTQPRKAKTWCALKFKWAPVLAF